MNLEDFKYILKVYIYRIVCGICQYPDDVWISLLDNGSDIYVVVDTENDDYNNILYPGLAATIDKLARKFGKVQLTDADFKRDIYFKLYSQQFAGLEFEKPYI